MMQYTKLNRRWCLFVATTCLCVLLSMFLWRGIFSADSDADRAFLNVQAILDAWETSYSDISAMKVRYLERLVEATGRRADRLVRNMHIERIQDGEHYHVRFSKAEQGFEEEDSVIERSFDGTVSKEYMSMHRDGRITAGLTGSNLDGMNALTNTYMMMARAPGNYKHPSGDVPQFSLFLRSGIKNRSVKVQSKLEYVAGEPCHVVKFRTGPRRNIGGDTSRIWVAHAKRMLPLKYEVMRDGKVIMRKEVLKLASTLTDRGEFWYPSEAYREFPRITESEGGVKYEFRAYEFVPHIRISSDTFNVDFPDGTSIVDEVAGIHYMKGGSDDPKVSGRDDPNSSEPAEAEPDLPDSPDESEPEISAESTGAEPNDSTTRMRCGVRPETPLGTYDSPYLSRICA